MAGRSYRGLMVAARISIVTLGAVAALWGLTSFPIFWQQSPVERTASQVIAGAPFKTNALMSQISAVEAIERATYCRPGSLRSAAIIRLRLVEDIISSGDRAPNDENMNALGQSIRQSFACSPADPFLWLVYFWMQSTQNGRTSEQLKYLRISYQLGPNEGWIGLKRNHIAFAIFEQLPPDLAENAIDEFVALLETGLYAQVAEIFTGPAWHVRNVILPRLKSIADWRRELFVKAVDRLGYDIDLPSTEKLDRRPWQ
jgi:hypothetical protein